MAQILSNDYQTATEIVFFRRGHLPLSGDGILAVFKNTPPLPNPEERAVLAESSRVKHTNPTGTLTSNQRFVLRVAVDTFITRRIGAISLRRPEKPINLYEVLP